MGATNTALGGAPRRAPLNRRRVVEAAVGQADNAGLSGVTMRAVAAGLGVEAMSLYNHVANRDDLLDGMIDLVFGEIELPDPAASWKTAMQGRAVSAHAALRRHPWAIGLMDSRRKSGPATLRHHDAVLGVLRTGGFSPTMAVHAVSLIDSYIYGYALQERSLPIGEHESAHDLAERFMADLPPGEYPYLAEVVAERASRVGAAADSDAEFAFGLALILDGLRPDGAS
ncbi:TetR/AcrR family transcriptional regulator [Dactylosporangium sucinum]|uniref:TetR family transcriptional regulator n=1 Tax=Dactylosporangium sucinum TaxID=1424081 RepID=A0A917X6Y0_9ACTN|nr:TetR/AcrR family transcriptional regulator C-terminal domain-containing protein [Dactylosporangium sucinum]GGM81261.1 TetR family transcriptional regulator [Dactylosporangium sucinum]